MNISYRLLDKLIVFIIEKRIHRQGRIQDFAQGGGARYKIYAQSARSAVSFRIIMINTLGATHIKKWSDEWSLPLRKKNIFFYDLKKIIEPHET